VPARLHVEVAVTENRRRSRCISTGSELSDRQRLTRPVDQLTVSTSAPDQLAYPFAGPCHVRGVPASALIDGMRRNSLSSSNHAGTEAAYSDAAVTWRGSYPGLLRTSVRSPRRCRDRVAIRPRTDGNNIPLGGRGTSIVPPIRKRDVPRLRYSVPTRARVSPHAPARRRPTRSCPRNTSTAPRRCARPTRRSGSAAAAPRSRPGAGVRTRRSSPPAG
jgi:hypothetical protein